MDSFNKKSSFNQYFADNIYAIRLNSLVNRYAKWLDGSGNESEIIISCRVRLARNLQKFPFPDRATDQDLKEIVHRIEDIYGNVTDLKDSLYIDINEISDIDRLFLMERRLISHDLVRRNLPAGLIIGKDELISIMINEEDHLRIQSIQSGLEITKAWQSICRIDDELAENLDFAFSEEFGYLTACPTNTGTGMRVSIFIHLPALAMNSELDKIIQEKIPGEITIRGFYGEGSDALGNIFQISNQHTLGRTEQSIIDRLYLVAETFIDMEKKAREKLLNQQRVILEDKIYRSIGILKYAKMISSMEVVNLLSSLRIGIDLEISEPVARKALNELMVLVQPAHLQKYYNRIIESNQRDILRAQLLKKKLNL